MSTLFVNTISPNSGDTVTISGSLNTTGKFTVGDAVTDNIVFNSEVSSSIVPDADSTYNLGSTTQRWNIGYIDTLSGSLVKVTTASVSSLITSKIGSNLNPEFGSSFTLGTMTYPWASLHVHGLGHIHTASLNLVSSSLLPNADNSHDIGGAGREWKDLYIDGTAFIDRIESPIIDSPSIIGTGSIVASILQVTSSGAHASFTTASFNKISSSLVPSSGSHFDLGNSNEEWRNVFTAEVSASKILASILTASNSDLVTLNSQLITVVSASTSYLNLGTDGTKISGSMIPSEPNIGDLGTMAMPWRNLHAHGLAHVHTASINLVSSSLIPSNTGSDFALGTMALPWASLHVHGLGHIHTASIGEVTSSLIPSVDDAVDLGSSTKQWKDLYVDGVAYIDTIDLPIIISPTITGTGSIDAKHITATHITASSLIVSGVNFNSSVLASADAAHLGSADGFNKFSVQGQLQAAVADGATSAEFTVGNTGIALGDIIVGTAHGALMGGLSQSNMIITTRTANSMSFVFNNESGLVAVDDSAFTASFAIIK